MPSSSRSCRRDAQWSATPDDRVAVDELLGQRRRLPAARLPVGVHVIAVVQVPEHLGLRFVRGPRDLSVHHREAREEPGGRPPELASPRRVVVTDDVDVGAETQRGRVAPRCRGRLARRLDPPRDPLRLGAEGKQHPVRMPRGDADDARSRADHLDRDLGSVPDPPDGARFRLAGEAEDLGGPCGVVRDVHVLEGDLLAAQVRLEVRDVAFEPAEPRRRPSEVREGAVAAPDAHDHAPARQALHGQRRRGRDRRMAGHRVRHGRREPEGLRRFRAERQADVRVAGQVLRVHDEHPVPAGGLRPPREVGAPARRGHGGGPELHGVLLFDAAL